ncbi:MAG TPA: pilin [Candidatus Paceibacterota bacterium]|nr:pilin [Candidatus Paceibacterota bacterium]
MFYNRRSIVLFFLVSLLFVGTASIARADNPGQGPYGTSPNCNQPNSNGFVPLACYSGSPLVQQAFSSGSLPDYINNIFNIVLSVGAILAVLRIAYGGYMYMGSADMWGNKAQAREIIGDAIIGLLLLFAIYLILSQINPNLLNLNVMKDITPVTSATSNCGPSSVGSANCP